MADQERPRYACSKPGRRLAVATAQPPRLNGIDYLEVANAAQTVLSVFFIHPLPGQADAVPPPPAPALVADNILIEGGVRVTAIRVTGVAADKLRLDVTVSQPGDFSTYTLRLVESAADTARHGVPAGFDPQLAAVDFSFKATCASAFDCREEHVCTPPAREEPAIDYLAKDYASFRKLMLDRLSVVTPDWRSRQAADLGVTVVEALAYVADELSYYQDAVASEAYLGTARQRISIRRHARLLDYRLHEGCNARAFVCLEVEPASAADGAELPLSQAIAALPAPPATLTPEQFARLPEGSVTVFEAMQPLTLRAAHNRLAFYTWSDAACCLPRGATRATLADPGGAALAAGQFVAFEEEISPTIGTRAAADPAKRHVVRLTAATTGSDPLTGQAIIDIAWDADDALPFPLCLSAPAPANGGGGAMLPVAVARANVLLVDHGQTIAGEPLVDAAPGQALRLARSGITWAAPWASGASARSSAANSVRQALPAVTLADGLAHWTPRLDLLASDRFAREFVVEADNRGRAGLRFGDGELGRAPDANSDFTATYRVGNGRSGNVGRETLCRLVSSLTGVTRVWNPLPAAGGCDPESIDQARSDAPQAFRTQERAVTAADYQRVAELHPEVQRARAQFRWTGSWLSVFVTVDRAGGRPVRGDPRFLADLAAHLDRYRLAGYDLEILDPAFVSLDLKLFVCVRPASFRSDVRQDLARLFSNRTDKHGQPAFFHADRFSFGDPLHLSRVVAAAMGVEGVASVEVQRFQRQNKADAGELAAGIVPAGPMEILRLDNDANFPEHGKIEFVLEGGL